MAFPRQPLLFTETVPHNTYETVEGEPLTDQNGGNTNALDDFIDHIADDQTDEEHEEDNDDTEDVLMSLKDFHDNADKCGPKINDKLAEHVMQNFHGRVSDEKAKTLTKNYDRPSNCNECFVPMTNEVVWPTLPKKTRDIDSKFQRIQQYQLKALYPTLRVFDKLFQASKDKKGLSATDTKECLKMTKDSLSTSTGGIHRRGLTDVVSLSRRTLNLHIKHCAMTQIRSQKIFWEII